MQKGWTKGPADMQGAESGVRPHRAAGLGWILAVDNPRPRGVCPRKQRTDGRAACRVGHGLPARNRPCAAIDGSWFPQSGRMDILRGGRLFRGGGEGSRRCDLL